MGCWLVFAKNLLKTWLDNHVLPGTTTGTEILWLYMVSWKRDVMQVITACVTLLTSRVDVTLFERVVSDSGSSEVPTEN